MKISILSFFTAGLLALCPSVANAAPERDADQPMSGRQRADHPCDDDLHGTTPNHDYFTGKPFTDDKADQKNRTCGLELLSPRSQTLARAKAGNPW